MINLFATNEELKRAHRHLDEARKEGNQAHEEQAMKAINTIYQEIGRNIVEELTNDELERIQVILDEAQHRIDTQELYNEMRFINTY